jgi:hypothetical protein
LCCLGEGDLDGRSEHTDRPANGSPMRTTQLLLCRASHQAPGKVPRHGTQEVALTGVCWARRGRCGSQCLGQDESPTDGKAEGGLSGRLARGVIDPPIAISEDSPSPSRAGSRDRPSETLRPRRRNRHRDGHRAVRSVGAYGTARNSRREVSEVGPGAEKMARQGSRGSGDEGGSRRRVRGWNASFAWKSWDRVIKDIDDGVTQRSAGDRFGEAVS